MFLAAAVICTGLPAYADGLSEASKALAAYGDGDYIAAAKLAGTAIDSGDLQGIRLVETYNLRGLAYHNLNRNGRAVSDFDTAIQLDPNYGPAMVNRCAVDLQLNDLGRAIEDCTKAISIDPTSGEAYSNRGVAYESRGMRGEAASDYLTAWKLLPGHQTVRSNMRRLGLQPN
jgi:Flp pilus assembly protein TadD